MKSAYEYACAEHRTGIQADLFVQATNLKLTQVLCRDQIPRGMLAIHRDSGVRNKSGHAIQKQLHQGCNWHSNNVCIKFRVSGVELQTCPRASERRRHPKKPFFFFFFSALRKNQKSSSIVICISSPYKTHSFPQNFSSFQSFQTSNFRVSLD